MFLPMQGVLELDDLKGPSQLKTFCDSVVLSDDADHLW